MWKILLCGHLPISPKHRTVHNRSHSLTVLRGKGNVWKVYLAMYIGNYKAVFLNVKALDYLLQNHFFSVGLHLWHMEVPRLGVYLELQLLAIATATATRDLSFICDLPHSSWQCWILNPLSEDRNWTHYLMVPSRIRFHCTTMGTPESFFKLQIPEPTVGLWNQKSLRVLSRGFLTSTSLKFESC